MAHKLLQQIKTSLFIFIIHSTCIFFTTLVCLKVHCLELCRPAYLALAEGALGAVFDPGGAAETGDVVLVRAGLGDVVADGVGQAGVADAAGAALALWHHRELAAYWGAGQWPAVHLALLWEGRERERE